MIKLLNLGITKEQIKDMSFDEVTESIAAATIIDSDEALDDGVHVMSLMNGPTNVECHGFLVGSTLVCVDSVELLVALSLALNRMTQELGDRSVKLALRIIRALLQTRSSSIDDKGKAKPSLDKELQMLFESVKEPKDPDA
jgi:hypothetical protein